MIARDGDDALAQRRQDRFQVVVFLGPAEVDEVAGQQDQVGLRLERQQLGDAGAQHRRGSDLLVGQLAGQLDMGVEIGRAACRERVCQYVEIWWVAVSLKKKTTQTP